MDEQTEAEKIRAALRRTRGTREYARIVAVNIVRVRGSTVQAAADTLGVDRSTIHDWLGAYTREGLDGLVDDPRPGRPTIVSRDELEDIVGNIKRFTTYEFVELVERKCNVKYSAPHARRLLRSLGFTIKKTHHTSGRATSSKIWQIDRDA